MHRYIYIHAWYFAFIFLLSLSSESIIYRSHMIKEIRRIIIMSSTIGFYLRIAHFSGFGSIKNRPGRTVSGLVELRIAAVRSSDGSVAKHGTKQMTTIVIANLICKYNFFFDKLFVWEMFLRIIYYCYFWIYLSSYQKYNNWNYETSGIRVRSEMVSKAF